MTKTIRLDSEARVKSEHAFGLAEGRSNRAIGERLFISEHTVEKHVKSIFATLSLPQSADDHRRVLAVVTYLNSQ